MRNESNNDLFTIGYLSLPHENCWANLMRGR